MSRLNQKCSVEWCAYPLHSRGMCRHHYGQFWRYGRILTQAEENAPHHERQARAGKISDAELDALRLELSIAQAAYEAASSLQARLVWRGEAARLRQKINLLEQISQLAPLVGV